MCRQLINKLKWNIHYGFNVFVRFKVDEIVRPRLISADGHKKNKNEIRKIVK